MYRSGTGAGTGAGAGTRACIGAGTRTAVAGAGGDIRIGVGIVTGRLISKLSLLKEKTINDSKLCHDTNNCSFFIKPFSR